MRQNLSERVPPSVTGVTVVGGTVEAERAVSKRRPRDRSPTVNYLLCALEAALSQSPMPGIATLIASPSAKIVPLWIRLSRTQETALVVFLRSAATMPPVTRSLAAERP